MTFEEWCLKNNRTDLLERWDATLNGMLPSEVKSNSNKKYWFKCPKGIHDSELYNIQFLSQGKQEKLQCKKCNSFAQYILDNYSNNFLSKIWHDDNDIDPWQVPAKSSKKAHFYCEENSSHDFYCSIQSYFKGQRCPICKKEKEREKSLGALVPEIFDLWSDKNTGSPYDYSLKSGKKVWWKCNTHTHPDYQRKINESYQRQYICPKCKIKKHSYNFEDLSGENFGELTVISIDKERSEKSAHIYWKCLCSCGEVISTYSAALKDGRQKTCGDRSKHRCKENNSNWKGGVTPKNIAIRNSEEYKTWREKVYAKGWYTCQCCGKSKGIKKHAHHLENFSENPSLRFELSNGITLCEECHYPTIKGSFHNVYGTIHNTPEQLEKFINEKREKIGIGTPFSIDDYKNGKILMPV